MCNCPKEVKIGYFISQKNMNRIIGIFLLILCIVLITIEYIIALNYHIITGNTNYISVFFISIFVIASVIDIIYLILPKNKDKNVK